MLTTPPSLVGRDIKQVVVIKWILKTFKIWSGLKVNFYKSHIIGIGGYNTCIMMIESIMGCVRGKFPSHI